MPPDTQVREQAKALLQTTCTGPEPHRRAAAHPRLQYLLRLPHIHFSSLLPALLLLLLRGVGAWEQSREERRSGAQCSGDRGGGGGGGNAPSAPLTRLQVDVIAVGDAECDGGQQEGGASGSNKRQQQAEGMGAPVLS